MSNAQGSQERGVAKDPELEACSRQKKPAVRCVATFGKGKFVAAPTRGRTQDLLALRVSAWPIMPWRGAACLGFVNSGWALGSQCMHRVRGGELTDDTHAAADAAAARPSAEAHLTDPAPATHLACARMDLG